jgi:phage portal protein BeeE
MFDKTFFSLSQFFDRHSGIYRSTANPYSYQYLIDQPAWLRLSGVHEFREAVASNPVLNGCIAILANAVANGKKYIVDEKGKEIPWTSGKTGVKNAYKLFVLRPNPLQSVKEFNYERAYMFFTFGNNYVYLNNPLGTYETDIQTVQTMYNLPSEWVTVRQTGKLYDQIDLKGIIEMYSLTNYSPVKEFSPDKIIHFNDVNTSNVGNSIIGSSRLEVLKYPITNTQLAFEAMNVILKSRGMQGIIKASNKDATGTQIPLSQSAKEEIDKTFKTEYGLREDQKQFMISYSDIDFVKTIMNSRELGIYEEFSNNAMIISNGLGVPAELYKTYTTGATFENQVQAVRRLYQDTVIPIVENEDQYYTERLKMRDYGFELKTDWSHIPALQEAFKEKATAMYFTSRASALAYNDNVITWNDYLRSLDLDPIPEGDVYKWQRPEANATPQVPITPLQQNDKPAVEPALNQLQ